MADTDNFAFDFYLPSKIKSMNATDFGENQLHETYKPHPDPAVDGYNATDLYDKLKKEGKDAEAQKVLDLFALQQVMRLEYGEPETRNGAEKNTADLEIGTGLKPVMVVKNLGGTGLNFNIEEGKSVVFPKDAKLTPEQVKELAHFFYIQGIPTEGLENFMFPENQDLEVIDSEHNVGSFKETFKSELDEVYQQARFQHDAAQKGKHWVGGSVLKEPVVFGTPYQMAQKVKARMSIASEGGHGQFVHCVRRDGGYYVYVYKDQKAQDGDGVIDNKTGRRAETKTCGIFCTIVNGVPKALIYTPDGKIDKNTTRYALEALKAVGCTHVKAPGAMDFGGAGMGTFWENCGKTLICPRTEPPKFSLDTGNVQELTAAIDKETKNNEAKRNAFKRVVAKELRRQANIQAFQKKYNTEKIPSAEELAVFCRDVPFSQRKSPDSDFEDEIAKLEGIERFTNFKDFSNDNVKGIQGYFRQTMDGAIFDADGNMTYSDRPDAKGDAVAYVSSIMAYAELIQVFRENDNLSNYLPNNRQGLLEEYKKMVKKYRKSAAISIQQQLENNANNPNYDSTNAVRDAVKSAQKRVEAEIGNTQRVYENFKTFTGYLGDNPEYKTEKYFNVKYKIETRKGKQIKVPLPIDLRDPTVYKPEKEASQRNGGRRVYGSEGR